MGLTIDFNTKAPVGLVNAVARSATGRDTACVLRLAAFARWADIHSRFGDATMVPAGRTVGFVINVPAVADGTKVTIEVRDAAIDTLVPIHWGKVFVHEGRVEEIFPGHDEGRPQWQVANITWDPWTHETWLYYRVTVDHPLYPPFQTSREFQAEPLGVLHVPRTFALTRDMQALLIETKSELFELQGILHKPEMKPSATTRHFSFNWDLHHDALFKFWALNTCDSYGHHHASHGVVLCRDCKGLVQFVEEVLPVKGGGFVKVAHCPKDPQNHVGVPHVFLSGPTGESDPLRGLVGPIQILNGIVLRGAKTGVPRYLAYFSCCQVGHNDLFARAYIARGTDYVLAFRFKITEYGSDWNNPDSEAAKKFEEKFPSDCRILARNFYREWEKFLFDPGRIPAVFLKVMGSVKSTLVEFPGPVLYGKTLPSPSRGVRKEVQDHAAFSLPSI